MSDEPAAGTPTPDAHSAEATAHAEAIADHDQDAGPGPDVEGLPHADDGHDAAHGGHGGVALGPIDWRAYGAGFLGAALGLVVAAVLAVTTGYVVL
ncbi:MAG: hypothetical protein MUE82_04925 [Chloroflexi bacterium]|jgi:hypothetical protein|nr:hypothetical protein [Chloroflexota bacterium]